jgi:hypothetical protein
MHPGGGVGEVKSPYILITAVTESGMFFISDFTLSKPSPFTKRTEEFGLEVTP